MNLDLQKVLPAEAFETEQNEGDYIGKDGLLYCGVCRTKKQTRLPASDFTGGREIIVPCICKCKVEENKRKEEEEKKRQEMQRLERLKASSLMDAKLKAVGEFIGMVGAVLFIVLAPIMFIAGIVALIVFGI